MGKVAEIVPMLSLYILAAIIALGILFLLYSFVGFSIAKGHKSERTDDHKADSGHRGMYKALLATFALIPATLSAQTNRFTESNSPDLQQQVDRLTALVHMTTPHQRTCPVELRIFAIS
jgi:hypothetical protein